MPNTHPVLQPGLPNSLFSKAKKPYSAVDIIKDACKTIIQSIGNVPELKLLPKLTLFYFPLKQPHVEFLRVSLILVDN